MDCTVTIDEDALLALLCGPDGAGRVGVEEIVQRVTARAWDECPVRTGFLRDSTHGEIEPSEMVVGGIKGVIGSDAFYGRFVHNGTWQQAANPYLIRALEAVTP